MVAELTLRPATSDDLPGIAGIHERARAAAVPAMPPPAHTSDEIHAWVASWRLDTFEVWVAETDRLVGYAALTATWLDGLYVDPAAQGAGIGRALLDLAKSRRPRGLGLWVFESNEPARSLYRSNGFVELEHTDGSDNDERAPDLRMAWPGEDPLAYLRGEIDAVDRELALLLARRAALTAAVQHRKEVSGPAGRDAARERQIADRMAQWVPALGPDRLQRIIDVIITESLDAADAGD